MFLPRARSRDLVIQPIGDELLVYDLPINRAYSLNKTLKLVFEACDGLTSQQQLIARDTQLTKEIINLALAELARYYLLEEVLPENVFFGSLTRREAVRRAALSSVTAIPVIAMLIAPPAMSAASTCSGTTNRADGCTCTANSNCATNCCGGTIAAGNDQCVQPGLKANGVACRTNCECQSNSCPPVTAGQARVCV